MGATKRTICDAALMGYASCLPEEYVAGQTCPVRQKSRKCGGAQPVMTTTSLKSHTVRDLAAMAKRKKVAGWHMMRKDELIEALVKQGAGRRGGQAERLLRPPREEIRNPQAASPVGPDQGPVGRGQGPGVPQPRRRPTVTARTGWW